MPSQASVASEQWAKAISLSDLKNKTKAVVKLSGKQILLVHSGEKIYALNNRCPHEGFPLAEGTLSDGCILTCNWHAWRFNLEDGEAKVGGDAVRLYPLEVRSGDIWLDIADPLPQETRKKAMVGMREAFDEHDYERIARELARYQRAKGNPRDALILALQWAMDGLEFGTTHAHAAAPDWLALTRFIDPQDHIENLIPYVEIIGHLSWDVLMQKGPYPYSLEVAEGFNINRLEAAIESENEVLAISLARCGLKQGGSSLLRPALERASLAHYQNFGHSVIFCDKTFELLDIVGEAAAEVLVLPLVRNLCSTRREDLIPEFKAYKPARKAWDGKGTKLPQVSDFRGSGVKQSLKLIKAASARTEELYDVVMQAIVDAMLHYDIRYRDYTDKPVQQNIDWLDFSHAITHLNAARKVCAGQPKLWSNTLLQAGCFIGRNAKFVDWDQDVAKWQVDAGDALLDNMLASMLDHGEPVYIFPAHVLKLATALKEELRLNPGAPWRSNALAAFNRFLKQPVKRKHMRRAVSQAVKFVEIEG